MKKSPTYLSDSRPKFAPYEIECGKIHAYRYTSNLASELKAKTLTPTEAVAAPSRCPDTFGLTV